MIHVPYDRLTERYTRYCFQAMQRMASDGCLLKLRLHTCNGNPNMAADNHSSAIGEAFREAITEPDVVHIVCDSDTVIVTPNWDLKVLRALETHDCIGTAYAPIGSLAAGHGRKQTYKDRPNVQWLALKPGKPWDQFKPAPTNKGSLVVQTPEDEETWGLTKGYELVQDCCWNFPVFLRERGLTFSAMLNTDHLEYGALKGFTCYEEWSLNGRPFVIHQGKSRKNVFRGTPFSKDFYERCDQLLRDRSGLDELEDRTSVASLVTVATVDLQGSSCREDAVNGRDQHEDTTATTT